MNFLLWVLRPLIITSSCIALAGCANFGGTHTTNFYGCDASAERCAEKMLVQTCTETANRYPYSRDRILLDEYRELLTEDATFQIEGAEALVGRDAVVQGLRERGSKNQLRHFSQVVDMQVIGSDAARGVSYVTIWKVAASAYADGNRRVTQPWIIGEYHDEFRLEDGRCRIQNRIVKIIFVGADD